MVVRARLVSGLEVTGWEKTNRVNNFSKGASCTCQQPQRCLRPPPRPTRAASCLLVTPSPPWLRRSSLPSSLRPPASTCTLVSPLLVPSAAVSPMVVSLPLMSSRPVFSSSPRSTTRSVSFRLGFVLCSFKVVQQKLKHTLFPTCGLRFM